MIRLKGLPVQAALTASLVWLALGCSDGRDDMTARAYRSAQPGAEILWRFPTGGRLSTLQDLGYYVEVEVMARGDGPYGVTGQAYFVGPRDQVLHIVAFSTDPRDHTLRFDTSGYTDALVRGGAPADRIRMFLLLEGAVRATDLPYPADLSDTQPRLLPLLEPREIPQLQSAEPLNIGMGEWRHINLSGPPPIVRQQGDQMAIYFYYLGPTKFAPTEGSRPAISRDLWHDLGRIGVGKTTELVTIRETPWPK